MFTLIILVQWSIHWNSNTFIEQIFEHIFGTKILCSSEFEAYIYTNVLKMCVGRQSIEIEYKLCIIVAEQTSAPEHNLFRMQSS